MNFFRRIFGPTNPPSADDYAKALLKAAKKGTFEEVRRLLELGTNVDAADRYQRSALMFASWNGHVEVVRYLLDYGANVNARDTSGNTALLLALGGDERARAEIYGKISASATEVGYALINTGRVDVNLQDKNGRTALMMAAWYGSLPLTGALIRSGADVNAALSANISVTDAYPGGALRGKYVAEDWTKTWATTEGGTALMMAAAQGHVHIVLSLLQAGADATITTYPGRPDAFGKSASVIAHHILETVKANVTVGTERQTKALRDYRQIELALDAAVFQAES